MELPDRLWKLIEVAVNDLLETEKDPQYVVDMGWWHRGFEDNRCHVCFAGVVMRGQLNTPLTAESYPEQYPESIKNKLLSLDSVRCGHIPNGIELFYFGQNKDLPFIPRFSVPNYHLNRDGFIEAMAIVQEFLKSHDI